MAELGKKFEEEMGVPVKIETQEGITDKFQAAAQTGKGPDIIFWAHDRIGEWADAGLLQPLDIKDDFKATMIPMSWDAVTHNGKIWGYPAALECVSLICNKKIVSGKPPTQLRNFPHSPRNSRPRIQKRSRSCGTIKFRTLPSRS